MRQFWLALTLLTLPLGCGKPVDPMKTLLALGDSYTIGEAVDENLRWPNQLAELLRKRGVAIEDVQFIATTGWTTDELNAAIDDAKPTGPYAMVSLLIGVNNQYRSRAVETFRPEFAALLKRAIGFAGGDAKKVFVVSIPDWGVMPFAKDRDAAQIAKEIDAYNAVCREESAKQNVKFIDITPISRTATTKSELIASDGLHPSGAQYTLWTEEIDKALR